MLAGVVEDLGQPRAGGFEQIFAEILRPGAVLQFVLNAEDEIAVGVAQRFGALVGHGQGGLGLLRLGDRTGFRRLRLHQLRRRRGFGVRRRLGLLIRDALLYGLATRCGSCLLRLPHAHRRADDRYDQDRHHTPGQHAPAFALFPIADDGRSALSLGLPQSGFNAEAVFGRQ